MSSDAFSTPVRKYDFGKDGGLSGQSRVVGAQYKMADHMCWARGDAVTAAAGVNVYLPFDVPPLPPGSLVRATVHGTFSTNDMVAIGASSDWLVASPLVTDVVTATMSGVCAGLNFLQFVLRTRSTWRGGSLSCQGLGVDFNGSLVDFGRSQHLAVYVNETTAAVMHHATVEVFVTRVYR